MRNKAGELISNPTKIESVYSHGIDFMVGDVVIAKSRKDAIKILKHKGFLK